MAKLALALWVAYYGLVLGLRVALHRRRTGQTGFLLGTAPVGSRAWVAETLELVALVLAVAAPAVARRVPPLDALEARPAQLLGIGLFSFGLIGVFASQQAMGASWRVGQQPGERTELITRGPFALVRNPIYICVMAVVAASALLVPSPLALAAVALIVLSVQLQVRLVEEPQLLELHGDSYRDYASRVGRFLPGLGRLR